MIVASGGARMTIFGVMSQNQDVVFFNAKLTYSKTFRAVFSKKGQ